jgi:hypothetical protein
VRSGKRFVKVRTYDMERTAKDIRECIKDILSPYFGDRKITSADVSVALHIPYNTYLTSVKRNSIPYREILLWCQKIGEDPNKIFFKGQT